MDADVKGSAAFAKLAAWRPDVLAGFGATAVAKLAGSRRDLLFRSGVTLPSVFFSCESSSAMAPVCNSLVIDSLFKEAPQPARSPMHTIAATLFIMRFALDTITRGCAPARMCAIR